MPRHGRTVANTLQSRSQRGRRDNASQGTSGSSQSSSTGARRGNGSAQGSKSSSTPSGDTGSTATGSTGSEVASNDFVSLNPVRAFTYRKTPGPSPPPSSGPRPPRPLRARQFVEATGPTRPANRPNPRDLKRAPPAAADSRTSDEDEDPYMFAMQPFAVPKPNPTAAQPEAGDQPGRDTYYYGFVDQPPPRARRTPLPSLGFFGGPVSGYQFPLDTAATATEAGAEGEDALHESVGDMYGLDAFVNSNPAVPTVSAALHGGKAQSVPASHPPHVPTPRRQPVSSSPQSGHHPSTPQNHRAEVMRSPLSPGASAGTTQKSARGQRLVPLRPTPLALVSTPTKNESPSPSVPSDDSDPFPTHSALSIPSMPTPKAARKLMPDDVFPNTPLVRTTTPSRTDWARVGTTAKVYRESQAAKEAMETFASAGSDGEKHTGSLPTPADNATRPVETLTPARAVTPPQALAAGTTIVQTRRHSQPSQQQASSPSSGASPSGARRTTHPAATAKTARAQSDALKHTPNTARGDAAEGNALHVATTPNRTALTARARVSFLGPQPRRDVPYREQRASRPMRLLPLTPLPFPDGTVLVDEEGRTGVFATAHAPPRPQPNLEGPPLPSRPPTTRHDIERKVGFYARDIMAVPSPDLDSRSSPRR